VKEVTFAGKSEIKEMENYIGENLDSSFPIPLAAPVKTESVDGKGRILR